MKNKAGVSVKKVSFSLGHSSVAITLDIYVHPEKKKRIFFSFV